MAERTEIADELNALAVHCPPRIMAVEAKALWLRDWCDDLKPYPIEAIRRACRQYRHSGQTKFPTAGQLLPMVQSAAPAGEEDRGTNGPWRMPSESEYQAFSLREKIRHHGIMATDARRKAGPMFRNTTRPGSINRVSGEHIPPDEMPDSWRRWTAEADRHQAEARRLREAMRRPAMAAE